MIKLIKKFRTIDWIFIAIIFVCIICQVSLEMNFIKTMGRIIGLIQLHGEGSSLTMDMLWQEGKIMLIIAFAIFFLIILVSFLASFVSSFYAKSLRKDVFKKVSDFSMEEVQKFSTPSLITRTTNDITQVQQTLQTLLRMAITAPTMAVFALREIVNNSPELTWATVGALAFMMIAMGGVLFLLVPKFGAIQKLTDGVNGVTRENLTGLRVIRAYNAEEYQLNKFKKVNTKLAKTNLFVNRVSSAINPGMWLLMHGLTLVIYWVGAHLIVANNLEYQTMVTFTQYAMHVIMSFMVISMVFVMIPRGMVSAKRIAEVLNSKSNIVFNNSLEDKNNEVCEISLLENKDCNIENKASSKSEKNIPTNLPTKNKVEFKNVSFKYPNAVEYSLKDISFVAEEGQTIAFIGGTGSGKSTLVNLIPRFYDSTEGEVLVDGINIRDFREEDLNKKIGLVPQKATLFSGTIEYNLKYGKENATREEIDKALKIAQCKFVNKLEDNINHHISQGGSNVSGGQRQRLCIARAVIRNPEIYIFDDSFSALDYKTDKLLRSALEKETATSTKLIVAQRIGTIMNADKIIVLNNGEIVGKGTHKELLKNCSVYKEIALSQLSKEELENE